MSDHQRLRTTDRTGLVHAVLDGRTFCGLVATNAKAWAPKKGDHFEICITCAMVENRWFDAGNRYAEPTAPVPTDIDGPAGDARTVAWLIERKNFNDDPRPHWYAENEDDGWHWWTPDASQAKRFATEQEAHDFPAYKMIASDPDISVTEHVFIAPAGEADGLVERVAQRLLEDAAYIENYSGFVGNPDYIAGNQREAAAAITQLRERAKHWEHEALCLGEFAATYNRDAELQNLMSLNNDLLERLATAERERDSLKQGEPDAAKALDALALRWAVKSWMTKDFPQQACEDFKHDILATYVSLARPYLNRAEAAEAKILALTTAMAKARELIGSIVGENIPSRAWASVVCGQIDAALSPDKGA